MSTADPSRFAAHAAWLELDAAALRSNARAFRALLGPGRALGAVLKGNAYGHGIREVLPLVHPEVDVLYLIDPYDALAVRALEQAQGLPRRRVLVTGAIGPEEVVELARAGIECVLADPSWPAHAARLRAAGLQARVHLFVDTGLGREGFTPEEIPQAVALLQQHADALELTGVLSHFANTEDVSEQGYALAQLEAFERGAAQLEAALGGARLERHFAASAATLVLPQARYDAVRVGISLYGLWPSAETRLSARLVLGQAPALQPVLAWRCQSQVVKWLPAGSYVGYGCTHRCEQRTRVAVLPVGYFDGYPRLASGKALVLVRGQRCPVLGRVMMNHLVVDVTRVEGAEGQVTATLLGKDGPGAVSAEMLAEWAQTISYEVVTRLGSHLRRQVVGQ